jgi:tetratricopeptide (TPR) repeat protein
VAVVVALRPSAVLARSTTASGAWAAIVAVTVQNFVDLGSEIPALVLAGTVCVAIVVAGTPGKRPKFAIEHWGLRPRRVAIWGPSAALAAMAFVFTDFGLRLNDDESALYQAALDTRVSPLAMHVRARAGMLRHPAEPYIPFAVALRASRAGDDNPIPWIETTLERAHVYGPAHLLLARTLARRFPSQARLEYRLAMEQEPLLAGAALDQVREFGDRLIPGYFEAMELVPRGKDAEIVLDQLVDAVKDRLPSTSLRLDAELHRRAPLDPAPVLRSAVSAVNDMEADASLTPWCAGYERRRCIHDALDKAARADRLAPQSCAPRELHARARAADGDASGAMDELAEAANLVTDHATCLRALVRLADSARDERRTTEAIDRLAKAGCNEEDECVDNLVWAGGVEEGRGNQRRALALYRQAQARAPDQDGPLESIARLAASLGLHAEAADAYRELLRRHPHDPGWAAGADRERTAALNTAVTL